MKEVKRYKCDYCDTLRATIAGMERHERQCVHNPNSINCFRCAYAYEGDIYNDFGYSTGRTGAICAYTEDAIKENTACECKRYRISSQMFYMKQECPETEESEG